VLAYFAKQALHGVRRSPLIQISAVGAIAMALLLLGITFVGLRNADRLTQRWGRGTHLLAYLKRDLPRERVQRLARVLRERDEIASARIVWPKQAFARLKRALADQGRLLEGIETDFLPASLEIRLTDAASSTPLLALLEAIDDVQEVDYLGQWAKRLGLLAALLRAAALLVAIGVCAACLYIIGTTIALGVHARRKELEIQRLVGATDAFINTPFLIEGSLQGFAGAALATAALYALFSWAAPRANGALGSLLNPIELQFLSAGQVATALLGGTLLGLAGSSMALARQRQR